MNIRSPFSSPQPIFYVQSLPIANVVKPRILLNRTSPVMAFTRTNSHYGSPVIKQQNPENMLKQSLSSKEIYYSPPAKFEPKVETHQRNLSPEALTVLDILTKIKNTTAFQMNKLKTQTKVLNQSSMIPNDPPPKEHGVLDSNEENYDVKTSTFKRSCNCSPKGSPKTRMNPEISFPNKTIESEKESDIKLYKIDLKSAVNQLPNAVEVLTIDTKNRNNSPKRRGSSSPKKIGFSPQLKNDIKSPFDNNKSETYLNENPLTKQNEDNMSFHSMKNAIKSSKDAVDPNIKAGALIKGNSRPEIAQIMNVIKSPNNNIKNVGETKFEVIHNENKSQISNPNTNNPNESKTEEFMKKSNQEKGSIQNLLGKINECLSKTSNILNKTYEETKNELSQQNSNLNEVTDKKNKDNEEIESHLLKITTSPVKEVQLELSDAMTIQSQFNDTLKSFNPVNSGDKLSKNLFQEDEKRKNENEYHEIEKILENNEGIYQIDQKNKKNIVENVSSPNPKGLYASPIMKENFSPIIERSERDEDKENNSPFINVYNSRAGTALPLSPKEKNEAINLNQEILRESTQENRIPTTQSPQNNNTNNALETPYNKEAVGLIMQSPNNLENEMIDRSGQQAVNPSNFYKTIKKETIQNKTSTKIEEKTIFKSEKKLKTVAEVYHTDPRIKKVKKPSESEKPEKRTAPQEINLNKLNSKSNSNTKLENNERGSYAKMAQKSLNNTKELSGKQNQILDEITTIDQEIENLEKDAQKEKIDKKMLNFYDNYKAYKHKLPSIQENEESTKRKISQTPLSSVKTLEKKKPEEMKQMKKEHKINDKNNKIVQERCNSLYAKAMEASQKKQREIDENQKKIELVEKNICTFKPDFISKKSTENILLNKEKVGQKTSLKTLKTSNDYSENPRRINQNLLHNKTGFKRTASQNLTKGTKNSMETLKLNKSLSPLKNQDKKNNKGPKSVTHSLKPWISPRSTSSTKTRRLSKENLLKNNNLTKSPNTNQNPMKKGEENYLDPRLNGEIFDILKIFSGINEVLANQKQAKIMEISAKEQNFALEKLRDISPIKPTHNNNEENSQNNKSFNENSINDMSSRPECRTSFEKVLGLLDQKHQHLLIKSMEMTKKVEKIFKESSVYAS